MTLRKLAVAIMLLVTLSTLRSIESGDASGQKGDTKENTCTLYIAESSMEGVNGIGIFTAKPFKRGSIISPPDSPSIPVCNRWPNSGLINHYWWGEGKGTSDDMSFECHEYTFDFFVMFGALPNYHTYLMNFITHIDDVPYDDTFVETTTNPGAGAFSYHGGRTIVADVDIEAGEELFLDYGLDYVQNDDFHDHWFENVPRSIDFEIGGTIMERSWRHLQAIRNKIRDPAVAEEVLGKSLQTVCHLMAYFGRMTDHATSYMSRHMTSLDHTLAAIRETAVASNKRMGSILPRTSMELDLVFERSHGEMPALSEALAKEVSLTQRSAQWLIENGRCVDNIVPGRSTLPYAGRGAFAQRFIARDEVVVPVPLIQLMDADALTIWEEIEDEFGDWVDVPVGKQLLLNYCFGHDDSSLLLCPITNAILINHCSNRTNECGKDGPNAEYGWDTDWDRDTKHWLNMTLDEIAEVRRIA